MLLSFESACTLPCFVCHVAIAPFSVWSRNKGWV